MALIFGEKKAQIFLYTQDASIQVIKQTLRLLCLYNSEGLLKKVCFADGELRRAVNAAYASQLTLGRHYIARLLPRHPCLTMFGD